MSKLFSALVGVSMLGLVGVANAAEPVALTEAQLDQVTAGSEFVELAQLAVDMLREPVKLASAVAGWTSTDEGTLGNFPWAEFYP
jgi:hypothetical protein